MTALRIQISNVRANGMRTAYVVNADGSIQSRKNTLAVKFPRSCSDIATAGSVWCVQGEIFERTYKIKEFQIVEDVYTVSGATLERPSGELLARWISKNIDGVGDVKARRLVRAVPDLDEKVRQGDVEALKQVSGISDQLAQELIRKWPHAALYDVIAWLQGSGLPMSLGDRLVRVYGDKTISTLKNDPFILLSFGVSFKKITLLIAQLNIHISADRFLSGISEHIASSYCQKTGSTVIPEKDLVENATPLCRELGLNVEELIESAIQNGSLVIAREGYQGLGSRILEETVSRFIQKCTERRAGAGSPMARWEENINEHEINEALRHYQRLISHTMTAEQREAVRTCIQSPVAVISGGAGTGKTTTLKAILHAFQWLSNNDIVPFLVALSGRAAKRMAQSTQQHATTIAKLISDYIGPKKHLMPDHVLLVVDEASMVDLLSFYKMVGILPYATRIILIGDAAQLPPIGGGLVFHAAIDSNIPAVHLSQVKRQNEQSGIHRLATSIRTNTYDKNILNNIFEDILYTSDATSQNIIEQYNSFGQESCIALTPTRKGPLGVDSVNKLIQEQFDGYNPPELHHNDDFRGWIPWLTRVGTKLRLNDKVIIISNDYDNDLRNGDIGRIAQVYEHPNDDNSYGILELDEREIPITLSILEKLELGYAVTIHKAQGSQWPACILLLPGYARHMIDQTLLYTAVTRPSESLVIMGDETLIDAALVRGNVALNRVVNITF